MQQKQLIKHYLDEWEFEKLQRWLGKILSAVKDLLALIQFLKSSEDLKSFLEEKYQSKEEADMLARAAGKVDLLLIDTHAETVKELLHFLTVLRYVLPEVEEIVGRITENVVESDLILEERLNATMDCYAFDAISQAIWEDIKKDVEELENILRGIYKKVKGEPGLYDIEVSWGEKD